MNVVIRTPEGDIFHEEGVSSLELFSELGAMQILPGHASLQAAIRFSPLQVTTSTASEHFVIQQGFVFVDQEKDEALILVYRAEKRAEIKYDTAKQYLEHVLQALQQRTSLSEYELTFLDAERLAAQERVEYLESQDRGGWSK